MLQCKHERLALPVSLKCGHIVCALPQAMASGSGGGQIQNLNLELSKLNKLIKSNMQVLPVLAMVKWTPKVPLSHAHIYIYMHTHISIPITPSKGPLTHP